MAKKLDLNSRAVKYVVAKQKGLSKEAAKEAAGYAPTLSTKAIESTKIYEQAEALYKDVLLSKIGIDEIAEIHARNLRQERDLGASNNSIKMAIERIEPDTQDKDEGEQVLIVMKG